MATEIAIKIFTIIFLVLSGNDHSVKVSSNSEMGPGQLFWSSQRIGVKAVETGLHLVRYRWWTELAHRKAPFPGPRSRTGTRVLGVLVSVSL